MMTPPDFRGRLDYISGAKLGRPFDEAMINQLFQKMHRMEEVECVEIEGRIGIQKRRYGWDLIKGKSPESAKVMILLMMLATNIAQELRIVFGFSVYSAVFVCIVLRQIEIHTRGLVFWQITSLC
jgi:hypothetical protein